jgi:hypothetical protein
VKLVCEVGNWRIVAHIAFKFYSVASGTFSTGSNAKAEQPRRATLASASEGPSQAACYTLQS